MEEQPCYTSSKLRWCLTLLFLAAECSYITALSFSDGAGSNHPCRGDFTIKRVSSIEECLDVLAFRAVSLQSERKEQTRAHLIWSTDQTKELKRVKQQLRRYLPRSIKDFEAAGQKRVYEGGVVQFMAVSPLRENTKDSNRSGPTSLFSDTAEVIVGAVDAQFEASVRARTFSLPPRIHIKNLRVHEEYRRNGIGTALVVAVEQFALTQPMVEVLSLKVETLMNPQALRLYEQKGFVLQEHVYAGFMTMSLEHT